MTLRERCEGIPAAPRNESDPRERLSSARQGRIFAVEEEEGACFLFLVDADRDRGASSIDEALAFRQHLADLRAAVLDEHEDDDLIACLMLKRKET